MIVPHMAPATHGSLSGRADVLGLDVEGIKRNVQPSRGEVAGRRRDLPVVTCLRRDLKLRDADHDEVAVALERGAVERPLAMRDHPAACLPRGRAAPSAPSGA